MRYEGGLYYVIVNKVRHKAGWEIIPHLDYVMRGRRRCTHAMMRDLSFERLSI